MVKIIKQILYTPFKITSNFRWQRDLKTPMLCLPSWELRHMRFLLWWLCSVTWWEKVAPLKQWYSSATLKAIIFHTRAIYK